MFDAEDVLDGLIRGTLSGRRKPWKRTHHGVGTGSIVNAKTILAAAGVAWGLYETWQSQRGAAGAGTPAPLEPRPAAAPAPAAPRTIPPPLPGVPAGAADTPGDEGLPPSLLQLLRLMISAARADGEIGPGERERILVEAREVGAEVDVKRELDVKRPLAEIVSGVSDPEARAQLYSLAFTIVRADEAVTGGERIYLAQLADRLGLDAAEVTRIESEVAARIDAVRPPPA